MASGNHEDFQEYYAWTVQYMAAHGTDRGTCIAFTAVASAEGTAVGPDMLAWPSPEQLTTGLVAIHVVHDLTWRTATVLSQKHGEAVKSQQVDLRMQ